MQQTNVDDLAWIFAAIDTVTVSATRNGTAFMPRSIAVLPMTLSRSPASLVLVIWRVGR